MLLPFLFLMPDVKPHCFYYYLLQQTEDGRCYCQVADGMATVGWLTGGCCTR